MDNFDKQLIFKYVPENKQAKALKKLSNNYPVQYIIGNVDFYGIPLKINKNVLIPRFETELLVSKLVETINKNHFVSPNILDVGTGSGCISIYLKKVLNCKVTAIDKSFKAIKIAKYNSKKTNVTITFKTKSIEKFESKEKFDILVSNPPYVSFNEKVDEKTKYEPQNAIFAKDNGLYFYKLILDKSKKILNKKSIIAFEIGQSQGTFISNYAKPIYPDSKILIEKDLNQFDRYIFIINE